MNAKTALLLTLAAASFVPAAKADIEVRFDADIRVGHALPPPPPEVVIVDHSGPPGPPPWARRHWYRRDYAYYYYPGCDVYYRPSDHMWFYLDGGNWRTSVRLPDSVTIDFGNSVSLTLESNKPWIYNDRVVAYYPRDYFKRVRVTNAHNIRVEHRQDRRDERVDRRDNRRDERVDRTEDRHDNGRDNGKGRGKDKRDSDHR